MARILLIDDDSVVREILRNLLEGAGHEVAEATEGATGTALYRNSPADVVITDIVMPEKEGIGTILELRREFPSVKIIAVSGGGEWLSRDSCLMAAEVAGAHRTFAKPLNVAALLTAVSELITVT